MTTTIITVAPSSAEPNARQAVARVKYETVHGRCVWGLTALQGRYVGVDGEVEFELRADSPNTRVLCMSSLGAWSATVEGRDVDALVMLVEHDLGVHGE